MITPIPQPPGIPLIGNIFDVDPNNTWLSLQKLWEKYGEIFKITVLGQQIVFVGSVALCEEICDEKRFRKFVGGPIVEIRYSVHDSLFTAYDNEPSWGVAHRVIAPLLSPATVSNTFTDMRKTASELTSKWRSLDPDERLSAIDELNRLNLEACTLCLYGKRFNCLTGPVPAMIQGMEGATSEAIKRPTRPAFLNWLWYQSKFEKDTQTMRSYASDLLEYRKAHPDAHGEDLLHALINGTDPQTGEKLDEQRIIDEIVTMPIGTSTAPGLIATALYYLLKNPKCIVKARQEIASVIGSSNEMSREHLDQLPYVQGIVRESLRLSAAAPGFNIEPIPSASKAPVFLAGGKYQVPPTQTMIVVLHGVNRDPSVFEDPEDFRPERMMGEAFEKLPAGAKKWFGNGKRQCIGRHYAWQWNMVTLVTLLRDLDLEMADPDYQLKQDGWFN